MNGSPTPGAAIAFELHHWSEAHWQGFSAMQNDPDVMADLGGPFTCDASREKFERYRDAWQSDRTSRWAVVGSDGAFLGYCGVMARADLSHPLGAHHEIGWRFRRDAWGKGLAAASATRALRHAWSTLTVPEILSYTAADNIRSQTVMNRIGLVRDADRDFTARYPRGDWTGLVWVAARPT